MGVSQNNNIVKNGTKTSRITLCSVSGHTSALRRRSEIRAMPETEKPPYKPVDIQFQFFPFPSGPISPRVLKKSAAPFQTALHTIGLSAPMQSSNPSVAPEQLHSMHI